jgi:ArsR family transcriptional regulator
MKVKSFNIGFASQVFKAFSDESRIRIVHLLYTQGELCSVDIEQVLEFTQSKTSRHLTYLKSAGLVSNHRQELYMNYKIKTGVLPVVTELFRFMADPQLEADTQAYKVLFSNRELVRSPQLLARRLGEANE